MITTKVSLQLVDQTVPAIIPVVQGDTGRSIIFEPSDFTIPEGATATYYIQKPSGEAVYNSAEITGNTVVCNLTAQSIIETGENNMQVRIILGEDIVTSFDAILMVRPFRGIDAVESETEINIFDKAVEQAEQEISDKADEIIAEKVPEIEALVEEVIESIPEDYTQLSNDVDDLKADLSDIDDRVTAIENGGELGNEVKAAILQLAQKVAYIDANGADYYQDLYDAFYPPAESISAVYTQSGTVTETTPLDDLKADLVVTAHYSGGRTAVLTDNAYTLSGTLATGTSTITVTFGSCTTTFTVSVEGALYTIAGSDVLKRYGLTTKYSSTVAGYYQNQTQRLCYKDFDLLLSAGKTYRVVVDWNDTYDLYVGALTYGSDVLTKVANQQSITVVTDSGWTQMSATDGVIEVTPTYDTAMRFNMSVGSDHGTTVLDANTYVNSIRVYEVEGE